MTLVRRPTASQQAVTELSNWSLPPLLSNAHSIYMSSYSRTTLR